MVPVRPEASWLLSPKGSFRDHEQAGRSTTNLHAQASAASMQPIPPPPEHVLVRELSGSPASLSRLESPRSVRDLGRDYSRYYNPFATHNNSTSDITSPPPQRIPSRGLGTAAAATLDASSKRLSNPFDDNKQVVEPKQTQDLYGEMSPYANVPAASNSPGRDPEKAFFPIYLDDRLGAPAPDAEMEGYNFPLYWDEKEPDDDMHLPMIDDDQRLKATWRDHLTRENVASTLGLLFMVCGLFTLFIVLPVLSTTGLSIIDYMYETPLDQMGGSGPVVNWATINASRSWPLLKNIRTGLIDPDTPRSAYTREALDGNEYKLVYSDEFEDQNRTFYPGDDPYWFAPDIWYGATQDLEWYDPDAVTTWDGALEIRLDAFGNHGLQFRSGMLNSWNQLCFKGGIFEVSVSLPGPGGAHGLWPGVWSMGNLGRPGYLATTDGVWPYTYNECDVGITPNQSSTDGLSELPGQKLTSCGCKGEEHPTPGTGRGAPEIDVIEVSGDWGVSISIFRD